MSFSTAVCKAQENTRKMIFYSLFAVRGDVGASRKAGTCLARLRCLRLEELRALVEEGAKLITHGALSLDTLVEGVHQKVDQLDSAGAVGLLLVSLRTQVE
jgi:hypothetical protein